MKRYTHFPQLVLGLTFNWGALLGWAAVHGSCDWTVLLPLYGSGVMWTLMYDTLYAHQDKKDDSKLGLKSTALYFGNSKTALYGFAGTSTAALMASGYCLGTMGLPFYLGVLGAGCHMTWQIKTADFDSRMNLNDRFVSNNVVGGIVMGGILVGGCC
jgi:4-hydroxybenzoate polyprenyltransferase